VGDAELGLGGAAFEETGTALNWELHSHIADL